MYIYIHMLKNCSRVFHKTGKMIDTVLSIVVGYQGICRPALATWCAPGNGCHKPLVSP